MAGSAKQLRIEGLDELAKQLGGLKKLGNPMAPARMAAAELVHRTIQAEAPVQPGGDQTLKRSVQINPKTLTKFGKYTTVVAIDHNMAPHSHLVEFGARGGNMPANPFFTRGYKMARNAAASILETGVKNAINKAIR
jgi:HK97 gp10 family phage protein